MSKGTILIVEDNAMNMDIATTLLELAGFNILQAEEGQRCLQLAKLQLDLILMDMQLPTMDGFEICKILKSDPSTSHIPIVAFTALAMDQEQRKALASGCVGVISKPIEISNFADLVYSYFPSAFSTAV